MNIEEARLVFVVWKDATTELSWSNKEKIEKLIPPTCYTVGWLVNDTDYHITVAQTVGDKVVADDDEDQPGNIWTIPKGMIVAIKQIKIPKVKGM